MAKRGRKKNPSLPRTESGRPSRSRTARAEEARAVAVAARARHQPGFPPELYADPRMGDILGRLSIAWDLDKAAGVPFERRTGISREQYEAGQMYTAVRLRYLRAMQAPGLPRESYSEEEPRQPCDECGSDRACDECAKRARLAATAEFHGAVAALMVWPGVYRGIVHELCINNSFDPEDIVDLRKGLNLLIQHFSGKEQKK